MRRSAGDTLFLFSDQFHCECNRIYVFSIFMLFCLPFFILVRKNKRIFVCTLACSIRVNPCGDNPKSIRYCYTYFSNTQRKSQTMTDIEKYNLIRMTMAGCWHECGEQTSNVYLKRLSIFRSSFSSNFLFPSISLLLLALLSA